MLSYLFEERERARRFYRDQDRNSYIVSHSALRVLLGQRLGDDAASIEFRKGHVGKPQALSGHGLQFNMSHSDGYTMIAIAQDVALGIDIEKLDAKVDVENIARHFFCRKEVQNLSRLPPERRHSHSFSAGRERGLSLRRPGKVFPGVSIPLK